MRRLEIRVDPRKVAGGWGAEKLGRLRRNGRLFGYSSLSRVVELEALALRVPGKLAMKLAMWRSLAALEPRPPPLASAGFPDLAARAERQREGLEQHRLSAVTEALG